MKAHIASNVMKMNCFTIAEETYIDVGADSSAWTSGWPLLPRQEIWVKRSESTDEFASSISGNDASSLDLLLLNTFSYVPNRFSFQDVEENIKGRQENGKKKRNATWYQMINNNVRKSKPSYPISILMFVTPPVHRGLTKLLSLQLINKTENQV